MTEAKRWSEHLPFAANVPEWLSLGNERDVIHFDEEQRMVLLQAIDPECLVMNLDAGPGTGKTTTTAAAISEVLSRNEDGTIILAIAVTNTATAQLAEKIRSFALPYPYVRPLRIVNQQQQQEHPSEVDEHVLLESLANTHPDYPRPI